MKKPRSKIKAVYTDLDSLFDTRAIMILGLTGNGQYDINFKPSKYKLRLRDNFGTLSSKIFHYFYSKRSKDILSKAPETLVNLVILEYFNDIVTIAKQDIETTVYLNTYPYNFTREEQEIILASVSKLLPNVNLITINRKITEIEKSWMLDKIGLIISYDAMKWLRRVTENVSENDMGDLINLKVYAPCIFEGSVDNKFVNEEAIKMIGQCYKGICDFEFLDSSVFSVR
jgi:hypothetical protein